MIDNLQKVVSILFSRIKTLEFKTTWHYDIFRMVLITKVSIGWVKGLVLNRRQAITRTNANQYVWGHCSLVAPYGVQDFQSKLIQVLVWHHVGPGHYLNWSKLTVNRTLINTLTPDQNGRQFADGISNEFSWMNTCALQLTFHEINSLGYNMQKIQHWMS